MVGAGIEWVLDSVGVIHRTSWKVFEKVRTIYTHTTGKLGHMVTVVNSA